MLLFGEPVKVAFVYETIRKHLLFVKSLEFERAATFGLHIDQLNCIKTSKDIAFSSDLFKFYFD